MSELRGTMKASQNLKGKVVSVGEDGGYYAPEVKQLDEKTMQLSFTASREEMAPVAPKNITLPAGPAGYTPQKGKDYIDGKDGASVTVQSVEESTADGGSNVVTFSDGAKMTVKNGKKPVKGEEYWTEEEQAELYCEVLGHVNEELAKHSQLAPEYANSVEELNESGDTTKLYVLPDGFIYAYIYGEHDRPEITIESGEGGYWHYDTNNDVFQWANEDGWNAKLSNRIPVTPGDQLSYRGKMQYSGNRSYVWFTADNVEISSQTIDAESKPVTITAPDGAAFLQCTSFSNSQDVILEIQWVLCQAASSRLEWASTGHAFVPADYEERIVELEEKTDVLDEKVDDLASGVADPLYGKKIVYDGDSICYGAGSTGGYAKIIAELTGGTYVNQGVGGGRLVTKGSNSWHSVVDNLPNLPTDGDLYCFEGGINDYWTSGMQLGTFTPADFDGELDTSTVCGALEAIFRYALNTFVGKPVCFVIVHKIQETAYKTNTAGNTFKEYRDAMVGICEKYSIPYYDAFSESGLNGWNDAQNEAFFTDGDGCHPNKEGYQRFYVPQLLDMFRKIIQPGGSYSILYFDAVKNYLDENLTAETLTFEMEDGSTVELQVVVR